MSQKIEIPAGMIPIVEIFNSIQGEGTMLGIPVTFIRVAGCNLTCPWCDTKNSWGLQNSLMMTPQQIADQTTMDIVVITGGEPCQYDLYELIELLHDKAYFVCIETNGTLPTPQNADWVTASPKPPEFTLHPQCEWNELKYVVDEDFSFDNIPEELYNSHQGCIWLQPEGNNMLESAAKAYKIVMEHPNLRSGVQLHKILGVR